MTKSPYVQLLLDGLQKKITVLDEIIQKNQKQMEILSQVQVSLDDFDIIVIEKSDLIRRLEELDTGFQTTFDRVRQEMLEHKAEYAEEIKQLQHMISVVTDKSVTIQTMESRNKKKVEDYFQYTRKSMKQAMHINRVASNYYNNMMSAKNNKFSGLDQKK